MEYNRKIVNDYSSFKSRGERQIAGFLEQEKIAYQYEYPLAIVDRGKTKIWYPDFKLPEYDIIIEYFGMNGVQSYNSQMEHKLQAYRDAGINGIYLAESSMKGPWKRLVVERIEQILEGKLENIRQHRSRIALENTV